MSAIVLMLERRGHAPDRMVAERMMSELSHRGPDGSKLLSLGGGYFGHHHFRTTPEESAERQPLSNLSESLHLAWDGRLDNRNDLLRKLGRSISDAASDASIVLSAFEKWGDGALARLLGPFALVLFDAQKSRVLCARDAMGDRSLFYHLGPECLLVASEERALLEHPAVAANLDEGTAARFFAIQAPVPGRTFYRAISELKPGQAMSVRGDRSRCWQFDRLRAPASLRYRDDREYAAHFRELLSEAIRCRMRAMTPVPVLMSGGLDSTSLAALAANESTDTLKCISWIFNETEGADEREFMDEMSLHCHIEAVHIPGDGLWPLRRPAQWAPGRNSPLRSLHSGLQAEAYRTARNLGSSVLLNGEMGDQLYAGFSCWLLDLVRDRRLLEAGRGLAREAWLDWRNRARKRRMTRRCLRPFLPGYPVSGAPYWLTSEARTILERDEQSPDDAGCNSRAENWSRLGDPMSAWSICQARAISLAAGVEVRRPYRDRRLIEFVLALPAYQLYRPGWFKWILREAMQGVLPEKVNRRRQVSSLLALVHRGLLEQEGEITRRALASGRAEWSRFVSGDWLESVFPGQLESGVDGIGTVVAWNCICWDLWRKGFQVQAGK